MSRLDDMVTYIETNGPITMNDLLTEMGFKDPAQRASAKAQLNRALEPGEDYRHLVDAKKILPSAKAGRVAKWEDGLERHPDKHPVVLESRALAPVRAIDTSGYTSLRLRDSVQAVVDTNLTGRKGVVVSAAMQEFHHQLELERVKREAAEERAKNEREVAEQYKSMVETLQAVIQTTGQNNLVPVK